MDRNVRYQRLPVADDDEQGAMTSPTEDEAAKAEEVVPSAPPAASVDSDFVSNPLPLAAPVMMITVQETVEQFPEAATNAAEPTLSPPPYLLNETAATAALDVSVEVPKYDPNSPPSYTVATELPTYEQVQQLKMEEGNQPNLAIDPERLDRADALLGTDFMFLCAFFVSFLFNWIGFLMLMCFCPTIAGRYGALAGFGLSLAKWTLIVKHSTELISTDNNWLWWLILAFGVLICVRAVLQHIHVKREWHLLTRTTQQRLMYFY